MRALTWINLLASSELIGMIDVPSELYNRASLNIFCRKKSAPFLRLSEEYVVYIFYFHVY